MCYVILRHGMPQFVLFLKRCLKNVLFVFFGTLPRLKIYKSLDVCRGDMGYLYFDESERTPHFALGAFVYSDLDLNTQVKKLFFDCGLDSGEFEFKSSALFSKIKHQNDVREGIFRIVRNCSIAIVVSENKKNIGIESLEILSTLLNNNKLIEQPHNIYFDQGLFDGRLSLKILEKLKKEMPLCEFNFECDSKLIGGIQVSDLVAYSCGSWLLSKMGILKKAITIQRYADAPIEHADLAWEMFLRLRYLFFFERNSQNFGRDVSNDDLILVLLGITIRPRKCRSLKTKSLENLF